LEECGLSEGESVHVSITRLISDEERESLAPGINVTLDVDPENPDFIPDEYLTEHLQAQRAIAAGRPDGPDSNMSLILFFTLGLILGVIMVIWVCMCLCVERSTRTIFCEGHPQHFSEPVCRTFIFLGYVYAYFLDTTAASLSQGEVGNTFWNCT